MEFLVNAVTFLELVNRVMKLSIMYLLLILLSGCINPFKIKWFKPNGTIYAYMPNTDNEIYKHGWYDGCTTSMRSFTKEFQKQFYTYEKDLKFYSPGEQFYKGKLITDDDKKVYGVAWSSAASICRHYTLGGYRSGFDPENGYGSNMPVLPGQGVGKMDSMQQVYEIHAWGPVGIENW